MQFLTIAGREVITCVHCAGTGTCQRPGYVMTQTQVGDTTQYGGILRCPRCGDGIHRPAIVISGFFRDTIHWPQVKDMVWPVCGVCGGKGHNVV